MLRLTHLKVNGLLGRFDHDIPFPGDWAFVIVHGPNGVGKTKLLELIDAVANDRVVTAIDIPFTSAEFSFEDGSVLDLVRIFQDHAQTLEGEQGHTPRLRIRLHRPSGETAEIVLDQNDFSLSAPNLRLIEREFPVERIEANLWIDRAQDDYIDRRELALRYASYLGEHTGPGGVMPEPITSFLKDFSVHLIETQRLIRFPIPGTRNRPSEMQRSTVLRYATDLSGRLGDALAENSRTSQRLDRTFPKRVLDRPPPAEATDERIRERYANQTRLRNELADIAVLDASFTDVLLPEKALEDWERRMLWTYLDDTDKKLSTFRQLLDRVQLLRRIVNSRFLFNELTIDRDRGFVFKTKYGQEIGADALSSGEQHELVLAYDLLFNVQPETTVLIDEPELSLHVTWQRQFLDDIVEIADLAALRFVVATHSPQIIHKWWDRAVPLHEGIPED
ncbi:MAG TPA: AAA family ATPase [Solirubrobacterales bacterium]|nr:AAA family ATPase [Solirubrobacterales bacterium]